MSAAGVTQVAQHALTLVGGLDNDIAEQRLRRVVWAAPKDEAGNVQGAPGLHDLGGTRRTALVNDLTRFGIGVEIRLRSLAHLREVTGKADDTVLRVQGPSATSNVAEMARMTAYTITTEWQEYPALFANWLDYMRSNVRTLGAAHTVRRRVKEIGDGGEVAWSWKNLGVRPVDLFEFRMQGDTMHRAVHDRPLQAQAHDWQERSEAASLREEVAEMRRMLRLLTDAPPLLADEPSPLADVPDLAEMPGGTFLEEPSSDSTPAPGPVARYRDEDDEDEGGDVSPAELARVVAEVGGGAVKGGKRR